MAFSRPCGLAWFVVVAKWKLGSVAQRADAYRLRGKRPIRYVHSTKYVAFLVREIIRDSIGRKIQDVQADGEDSAVMMWLERMKIARCE